MEIYKFLKILKFWPPGISNGSKGFQLHNWNLNSYQTLLAAFFNWLFNNIVGNIKSLYASPKMITLLLTVLKLFLRLIVTNNNIDDWEIKQTKNKVNDNDDINGNIWKAAEENSKY